MVCDMCGSQGKLFKAIVEGTELNVCQKCARFGSVISPGTPRHSMHKRTPRKTSQPLPEPEEIIIENYPELIKQKREKLGLTQEKFAQKLNEKESLLQKIESGHIKPSLNLAKKIQNFLGIKLIEQFKPKKILTQNQSKSYVLTIGDILKLKKKQG